MNEIWFVFLSMMTVTDIWNRRIPVSLLALFGLAGAGSVVIQAYTSVSPALAEMLWKVMISGFVGLVLLLVSLITQGALGTGDGWFFLLTGLYLPWNQNLGILCYGLFFSSLYGMGVFIWGCWNKKQVRKKRIPFLPFVWLAALVLRAAIP